MSQMCLLKLIFDEGLYDEMTDLLLGFPGTELAFLSVSARWHAQQLPGQPGSITEQVSGFKRQQLIELAVPQTQANQLYQYLKRQLPPASFRGLLLPLLSLEP